ncbi:hypothetical protein ACQVQY_32590 [Bacillus mycoides]|uniref:hypothetical protein n=1 Tax=Bacillus mycoides TaxID=1405 RepID=UPI003D653626
MNHNNDYKNVILLEGFGTWVQLNGNQQYEIMFDWDRVRDYVFVKNGTYTE